MAHYYKICTNTTRHYEMSTALSHCSCTNMSRIVFLLFRADLDTFWPMSALFPLSIRPCPLLFVELLVTEVYTSHYFP